MTYLPLMFFGQWLLSSTAAHNDCLELKLSRARKLSDSSRSMFINIREETRHRFLMKTKIDARKMKLVRRRVGFAGCLTIEVLGRKGLGVSHVMAYRGACGCVELFPKSYIGVDCRSFDSIKLATRRVLW